MSQAPWWLRPRVEHGTGVGVEDEPEASVDVADGEVPLDRSGTRARRLDGLHVLVVEDEPDARDLVGTLLEKRGATVDLTASAAEAYACVNAHVPDIIVSDIGMPDEDGYQFARRLRALPTDQGGTTPMVALTAYASAHDRRRAMDAGYDHHLAKPVDIDELVRILAELGQARPR